MDQRIISFGPFSHTGNVMPGTSGDMICVQLGDFVVKTPSGRCIESTRFTCSYSFPEEFLTLITRLSGLLGGENATHGGRWEVSYMELLEHPEMREYLRNLPVIQTDFSDYSVSRRLEFD